VASFQHVIIVRGIAPDAPHDLLVRADAMAPADVEAALSALPKDPFQVGVFSIVRRQHGNSQDHSAFPRRIHLSGRTLGRGRGSTIRGYYDELEADRDSFTRNGLLRSGDLMKARDHDPLVTAVAASAYR
jgi:hypothetical protein